MFNKLKGEFILIKYVIIYAFLLLLLLLLLLNIFFNYSNIYICDVTLINKIVIYFNLLNIIN